MTELQQKLKAKFPPEVISFRANNINSEGTQALALAYIDARDVMNRLDEVCGVANWQARYSHADNKTICEIGIKIGDDWVWKANGAGDSDIEAEKGAVSDAFKRAAVLWGIGRYLYQDEYKNLWVDCETTQFNGKYKFKKWKVQPYLKVKQAKAEKSTITIQEQPKETAETCNNKFEIIVREIDKINDVGKLTAFHSVSKAVRNEIKNYNQQLYDDLQDKFQQRKNELMQPKTLSQMVGEL